MNVKDKVYLDYASTSPLSLNVKQNIDLTKWYNASSIYFEGGKNRQEIENVRKLVAKEINAEPEEIVFVSSGSEANALAIDGFLKANKEYNFCYCTNVEHASIKLNPNCVDTIKVDCGGVVNFDTLPKTKSFCSVMMCNNEIGVYQPVKEICEEIHKNNGILHVDAVQTFGKVPIDVKYLDIDMMSISGHKIGALKGVGALYVKKGIKLSPIIHGTQESYLRGGTLNSLAIKSLGCAIKDINYNYHAANRIKRDFLLNLLLTNKNIKLNGSYEMRNESNINIRIDNITIDSQQIVTLLDERGYMVSAGSACHSYENEPSYVLKAIGLTDEEARHSIRITIGNDTDIKDLDLFAGSLFKIIEEFKE